MPEQNSAPRMLTPDVAAARAGQMLNTARWAVDRFSKTDAQIVKAIVKAMADAAFAKAGEYAERAVRETGYGRVEHKIIKNQGCSRGIYDKYADLDFVTPRIDHAKKTVELARPAGVVFALTPVTNPVATVYFKTILAILTRNAIIVSPHPGAKKVCADAVRTLSVAAQAAGAPPGLIQIVEEPTIPLIDHFMKSDEVDLIVATGGPAVVKAAYRSGNPAIGVGSGNAPVLVDDTCDLRKTAQYIVGSKGFDNSVLCTNESTILAFESVADRLLQQLKQAKAHICKPDEVKALRKLLFTEKGFNVEMIGKDASVIAEAAGFRAQNAEILVAPVDLIQPEEPLVREKLCPVLAFGRVADFHQGLAAARSVMRKSGKGHSAVIHSTDERRILAYANAVPALRIVVNVGCSLGASGFETNLGPSMTIGTGFAGGSSVGENLKPDNFINLARIAYNSSASEPFGVFEGLERDTLPPPTPSIHTFPVSTVSAPEDGQDVRAELRKLIQEELKAILVA
ncbi:aldehyde dehydrogenase family protein [Rhizobium sp. L1K21]|uniref:aldehyde dehydrogenase family protein n=1 Tax=Rhizobium sp. L1K21 TaxID=2954933 RepID=UPI0020922A35|nr:aldehyde dehydrogenase family protein [Rhizobium sp. L1K21]MCO6185165.1 aldehyde dehydrogenase family protein [Rhizobium sp. L1K21]